MKHRVDHSIESQDDLVVVTYLDTDPVQKKRFSTWKSKAMGPWHFAVVGEWSTLSGFSGQHRFWHRTSVDRLLWAIMLDGFPTRIVAVARVPASASPELVIGSMIRRVGEDGGAWIESILDIAPDLDIDLLLEALGEA